MYTTILLPYNILSPVHTHYIIIAWLVVRVTRYCMLHAVPSHHTSRKRTYLKRVLAQHCKINMILRKMIQSSRVLLVFILRYIIIIIGILYRRLMGDAGSLLDKPQRRNPLTYILKIQEHCFEQVSGWKEWRSCYFIGLHWQYRVPFRYSSRELSERAYSHTASELYKS